MMIMTVDIGGTKTMWAFWKDGAMCEKGKQPTASIKDFGDFIGDLIRDKDVEALSFALAGPVKDNKLELTNTGQIIDLQEIKERFSHVPHVVFLNDLEALGHSLLHLKGDQLGVFRAGKREEPSAAGTAGAADRVEPLQEPGARAILSIGTGLGIGAVTREGIVVPSEGGHIDFAPRSEEQHRLLYFLEKKYNGHVSYERILSGHGLANLYEFITGDSEASPADVTKRAADGESAALETFRLFTEILGAACGNFAVIFMSSGGVYLGGGMTPKILPYIDADVFEKSFTDKGRFSEYIDGRFVYAILDEDAPSLGAACAVSRMAGHM